MDWPSSPNTRISYWWRSDWLPLWNDAPLTAPVAPPAKRIAIVSCSSTLACGGRNPRAYTLSARSPVTPSAHPRMCDNWAWA